MTVLIITKSDDNECIKFVTDAINERGGSVFRLDTDRFPTEVKLAARYSKDSKQLVMISEQGELDLCKVSAIWHRRLNIGGRIPLELDHQIRSAAIGESRATLLGMLASLNVFRIDEYEKIKRAGNKQLQLQVAREVGLNIPRTLITNDPQAAKDFAKTCESGLITKMLSSFAIYEEGQEKVVFTSRVKPEHLEEMEGLRLCPMTFQEMVPKALELRVTIVGNRAFTASIDSQSSERASLDWRRDGVELLRNWKRYELPGEVEQRLMRLMDYFGLNYGAIDIIVTPDGRHIFLEINPVGEFFWLERYPGLPISQAIADVLLGRDDRRV